MSFDIDSSWAEYVKLMGERPESFINSDQIHIVKDEEVVRKFCKETGKKIGVVYKSDYNIFLVDLIRAENGNLYTFERLLPAVKKGSVVMLTSYNGKFLLLNQYRHALRDYQYSFPRGFGTDGVGVEDNVRKELIEETGGIVEDFIKLGTVVADSGLSGNKVSVYACIVSRVSLQDQHEGIKEFIEVTQEEFGQMVIEGKITDGFTLSAYSLYCIMKGSSGVTGQKLSGIL